MSKDLDALTAIKLGQALFAFLARKNEDSESDVFHFEDAGVEIASGFIEIDSNTMWTLNSLLDTSDETALGHSFQGPAGHQDDDECTHRDGTDDSYCGKPESAHT